MNPYLPILVLAGIAAVFAVSSVVIARVIGPSRSNRSKLEAYECGIEPISRDKGAGRFPIKYYLTAMLFIVFDIEIVFLYPWAVSFEALGVFALVENVVVRGHCLRRVRLRVAPRRPELGLKGHAWASRRSCQAGFC